MPSLDELDATPAQVPTRDVEVCLDGQLVVRMAELTEEIDALASAAAARPRKGGAPIDSRLREARAELEQVSAKAGEQTGALTLRKAIPQGDWMTFVDEHPPRPEKTTGRDRDDRWAHGLVNVDALIARIADFAHAWDGQEFKPGQFERALLPRLVGGDIGEAAKAVVELYEGRRDFHVARTISDVYLTASSAFSSPETSESPRESSTAGRPAPSSEATTKKASE
ncbi:hypothetical protein [Microbacterium sp.]|uniref:hypothetical protein n=1 Tax=Microbacterium sp. TaxID=51671 RepID=UPI003735B155